MKRDHRTHILLRYGFISVLILLLAGKIVFNMFSTTVLHSDDWNKAASRELDRTVVIQPERGEILACDGSVLATNLRYYTIRIDSRCEQFREKLYLQAIDSLGLPDSMARYFPRHNRAGWEKVLRRAVSKPKSERKYVSTLIKNVTFDEVERIRSFPFFNIGNRAKTGFIADAFMRRSNPYGDMARRSIGGVGQDSVRNYEIHGWSGLEKALDSLLYGRKGVAKKVALTRYIANWTDTPAVRGYDIRTTIDIDMQDIVENELNRVLETCDADWGVAVLMEVSTGDIKAISNLEKSKRGKEYIEGMNRAVIGYEPGSVVKPISMLIALEDGLVRNVDSVISTGFSFAYLGKRPITDSHGTPSMRVREVIERSSNIGMAKIITRGYEKDPAAFYRRLESIGFLDEMHLGIAGERIPSIKKNPSRIDLSRMCYGYTTEIPPIYTLSVYNAIANGGRYVRPRLVTQLIGEDNDTVLPVAYMRDRICSEENAAKLRNMLKAVVWGDHGTGKLLRNDIVEIAGKTGTCYMVENGQYVTSKKRLAFCGFFPADNPKYSCIVLTCYPKQNMFGAASTSGQVLKNIALKMFSRGMLDNSSDYREVQNPGTRPVMYATADKGNYRNIKENLAITHDYHPSSPPAQPQGCVPSVAGLGLREAISKLESSDYNVKFNGTGYVHHQEPAAGEPLSPGSCVSLILTEF